MASIGNGAARRPTLSADAWASLALAVAALLWSGNFIAGRALRNDIDPVALNLLRWTLSLLIFLPYVGTRLWRSRSVVVREWRLVAALGATGIAGFHTLVYLALQTTTAVNALLMLSVAPTAILIGAAATGDTRPTRLQWTGTLVSMAGAGILVTHGHAASLMDWSPAAGDLWMMVAVLLWAAYSLLLRRRPADLPPDVTLAASIVPAIALLLPVALWTATALPAMTFRVLGALAYIALFASLVGFLLWTHGVSAIGPARAGQYLQLMPVFGAALAVVVLDEGVDPVQVAGAAAVFAGIALVQRQPRPPIDAAPAAAKS